jgi:hypothetical protein
MEGKMKSLIIFLVFLSVLAIATIAVGVEAPAKDILSDGNSILQLLKKALPQLVFLSVLLINLITSLVDSDRNFKASLTATIILVAITYWGNFYKPLFDFFAIQL